MENFINPPPKSDSSIKIILSTVYKEIIGFLKTAKKSRKVCGIMYIYDVLPKNDMIVLIILHTM
jgi:hypothetical protein